MFNVHEDFNNSRKWKLNFSSRVTKPSTEFCTEENCNDRQKGTVREYVNSVKVQSGFKVLGEMLKVMSNIILQLMFSIDGDYNN